MKFFNKSKDGGPNSPVDAYFLCEIKGLFSVALLKFNKGCREEYHTHAFNAFTWFIKGELTEEAVNGRLYQYKRSLKPKLTTRLKNHRVIASEDSWCATVRGPWSKYWEETSANKMSSKILTHGRKVVKDIGTYIR
jgi:hypothetical protein